MSNHIRMRREIMPDALVDMSRIQISAIRENRDTRSLSEFESEIGFSRSTKVKLIFYDIASGHS